MGHYAEQRSYQSQTKVKPKYFYIGPFADGRAEVRNTESSDSYYINSKLEKIEV